MNDLGKTLKKARENRGLTQEQVGRCLDMTAQGVSSYERDLTEPDYQTFMQLADLYRVSADELLKQSANEVIHLAGLSEKQAKCIISTIASFLCNQ